MAVGETASFSILTHCGVESATIKGHWWHAVTPLYGTNGEGSGPPAGWGDPWQPGTLTLEADERAVFETLGQRVVLKPSPTDEPISICR